MPVLPLRAGPRLRRVSSGCTVPPPSLGFGRGSAPSSTVRPGPRPPSRRGGGRGRGEACQGRPRAAEEEHAERARRGRDRPESDVGRDDHVEPSVGLDEQLRVGQPGPPSALDGAYDMPGQVPAVRRGRTIEEDAHSPPANPGELQHRDRVLAAHGGEVVQELVQGGSPPRGSPSAPAAGPASPRRRPDREDVRGSGERRAGEAWRSRDHTTREPGPRSRGKRPRAGPPFAPGPEWQTAARPARAGLPRSVRPLVPLVAVAVAVAGLAVGGCVRGSRAGRRGAVERRVSRLARVDDGVGRAAQPDARASRPRHLASAPSSPPQRVQRRGSSRGRAWRWSRCRWSRGRSNTPRSSPRCGLDDPARPPVLVDSAMGRNARASSSPRTAAWRWDGRRRPPTPSASLLAPTVLLALRRALATSARKRPRASRPLPTAPRPTP